MIGQALVLGEPLAGSYVSHWCSIAKSRSHFDVLKLRKTINSRSWGSEIPLDSQISRDF